MVIAVDFDGTIVEHKYPNIGKPLLFAFETMKQLQKQGHQLILWTYRSGKELNEAVEFCSLKGIDFYAVNSNYPGEKFNEKNMSRKIYADLYIDDRIIGGFPGWSEIWELLNREFYKQLNKKTENELSKLNISNKLKDIFKKK
jgi:hydroxymethylpyrimidine pyrophosphatase-like HAD family hydrolase